MCRPQLNQKFETTIQRLGIHGEGIAYLDGYTIFIDGALPGEIVQARLIERKKNYGRGSLLAIEKPSPSRILPVCPLFSRCGGCQIMHLGEEGQLEMKQKRVFDSLERIGKFSDVNVLPCIPSPSPLAYRNKIQIQVRSGENGMRFGFYARHSHDLVDIEKCPIHCELGENVLKQVISLLRNTKISAFNWKTHQGELRHVIIRTAVNTGQALVVFVTRNDDSDPLRRVAEKLMKRCPSVKGVVQNINVVPHNVVLGDQSLLLAGSSTIEEQLCGMKYHMSPTSFFQVNTGQVEQVYAKVVEFAQLSGKEAVLDAYCGVGTLTLLLAKYCKQVIGVECIAQAIEDAKENGRLNQVGNVQFACDEVESWIKNAENMDVVVLNPPRKGCAPSVLEAIGRLRPKVIVYLSCDPATLARDLAHLRQFHYSLEAVQPFDMFPQTAHVETVAKLCRQRP